MRRFICRIVGHRERDYFVSYGSAGSATEYVCERCGLPL